MDSVNISGIEKISAYTGSMMLPMCELVKARKQSEKEICGQMMIKERSVTPPWEDPVTLAVNAANRMLTEEDRKAIGLIMVATETGVDQEKSLSTWAQRYLNLPDDCRNAEVKIACYGGTAALFLARGALSLLPAGRKVLVITTDVSRTHFGKPYEFVMGCGATAFIVSHNPVFLAIDPEPSGVFTYEVSDLIRPTSRVEAGHSETSLLSYLEGCSTTFERFMQTTQTCKGVDSVEKFRKTIPYQVYHAPFGGITKRAHKAIHRYFSSAKMEKEFFLEDYTSSVIPSLQYNRRIGGSYASSIFFSLLGLADFLKENAVGKRVGVYSYGSGSCAEFFTVTLGSEAYAVAKKANIGKLLDKRKRLTVAEYEAVEEERETYIDAGDFKTSDGGFASWYESYYRGKDMLVFTGCEDFVRSYKWI